MIVGTLQIKRQRFVIVPEAEYERLREVVSELAGSAASFLPKSTSRGRLPTEQQIRAGLAAELIGERRRIRLSQVELARRAGIRPESLCRIEKGLRTPDIATLNRIRRALKRAEQDFGK